MTESYTLPELIRAGFSFLKRYAVAILLHSLVISGIAAFVLLNKPGTFKSEARAYTVMSEFEDLQSVFDALNTLLRDRRYSEIEADFNIPADSAELMKKLIITPPEEDKKADRQGLFKIPKRKEFKIELHAKQVDFSEQAFDYILKAVEANPTVQENLAAQRNKISFALEQMEADPMDVLGNPNELEESEKTEIFRYIASSRTESILTKAELQRIASFDKSFYYHSPIIHGIRDESHKKLFILGAFILGGFIGITVCFLHSALKNPNH